MSTTALAALIAHLEEEETAARKTALLSRLALHSPGLGYNAKKRLPRTIAIADARAKAYRATIRYLHTHKEDCP